MYIFNKKYEMAQAFYHNTVGKDTKKETYSSFLLPSWFLVQFYVALLPCITWQSLDDMPRAYGTACFWLSFVVLFVLKKPVFCLLVFVCICVSLWRLLYPFSMSCLGYGKAIIKESLKELTLQTW